MASSSAATIVDIARQNAIVQPERSHVIFLQDGDQRETALSFAQLDRSARHIAAWFQEQGLQAGDRVMIMLPNGLEFVQVLYGCFYAGIIAVPQPQQLQAYLSTFLPTIRSARPRMLVASLSIVDFVRRYLPEDLKPVFTDITVVSAHEILQSSAATFHPIPIESAAIAYLQYTSGSTGTPKGVMISHRNILANMAQASRFGNWEAGKGTALWLPLFHDFGLAAGLLGAMANGGFVVLMTPAQFMVKPVRWLNAISRFRCAYSYAPPFGYDLCIRRVSAAEKQSLDLSCLVSSVYGAEPVHYLSVKRFNDTFAAYGLSPTAVRPGFGMAETVIMFSESDRLRWLDVDREILESQGRLQLAERTTTPDRIKRLVNLGPSMDGHEIVIRDDVGRALPEGRVGEIMLQGPSVCEGYFENPTATQQTFRQTIEGKDGHFLATGDLGFLWDGDLYFAGRIKDIIILRGRNHYPQDIEHAVPLGRELRPDCVMAFAVGSGDSGERLAIAMEVEAEVLKDTDLFFKYILPTVDQRVVAELGRSLQVHPEVRFYLRPGTLVKTSSGKIKHHINRNALTAVAPKGVIARLPEPATTVSETAATVHRLFIEITGRPANLDEPLVFQFSDSDRLAAFLDRLQACHPVADVEIGDWVTSDTRMTELIDRLETQLLSGAIAF
jgi:acyl-CoA synthetase (AMP-forming)/AMP-acid ligase II